MHVLKRPILLRIARSVWTGQGLGCSTDLLYLLDSTEQENRFVFVCRKATESKPVDPSFLPLIGSLNIGTTHNLTREHSPFCNVKSENSHR